MHPTPLLFFPFLHVFDPGSLPQHFLLSLATVAGYIGRGSHGVLALLSVLRTLPPPQIPSFPPRPFSSALYRALARRQLRSARSTFPFTNFLPPFCPFVAPLMHNVGATPASLERLLCPCSPLFFFSFYAFFFSALRLPCLVPLFPTPCVFKSSVLESNFLFPPP